MEEQSPLFRGTGEWLLDHMGAGARKILSEEVILEYGPERRALKQEREQHK